MSFDKNKAMRSAEKFLAQGKIRGAINEYQRVVENDPKDYSTLNILGDLYAKNRDKQEAVGCFTLVAEYYNKQGFSHKAIAVYNKISRIEPGSIEVSAKLAELYQSKGSVAEARVHYTTLAEHYQKKGQKIEALAIWKQIAELDPNNTEIYLKIAESCRQEEQLDEAARAFTEAGLRFIKHDKFESALTAFSRALEIKQHDLRALKGLVKSQIGLGCADEAATKLEEVLTEQPNNRDVLYLLVDCYLDMNNPSQAESAIVKLVEQEPANYLKYLELVRLYVKGGDLNGAVRILEISSEHLLGGGQSDEFLEWTNEILARNPEQIEALRLLVRYHGWKRDEAAVKQSLERLAEAARINGASEDEHYALSQLLMMAPQESGHTQRLQELTSIHGFETKAPIYEPAAEAPQFENFAVSENAENAGEFSFEDVQSPPEYESNGHHVLPEDSTNFEFYSGSIAETTTENIYEANSFSSFAPPIETQLSSADELKLQKEIDSIEFYIEQDYRDLAAKALDELEAEFGGRTEIAQLRARLNGNSPAAVETQTKKPAFIENTFLPQEQVEVENFYAPESENVIENSYAVQEPIVEKVGSAKGYDMFDEFKNELDAEEEKIDADEQYETHYQSATAYKEMGLLENAIREFQDAINLVKVDDGTRRFFQCANLLGHCFMEKEMPKAAVKWFLRDLEVTDLTDEEKHAIYYDLGNAFEASGEREKSVGYFEQLYTENIDYRDVSRRLENLQRS